MSADRLEQVSFLQIPAQEIKYGGGLEELFLPGQKAKLLLGHHSVGCRMENAFFPSPVRNTLGSLSVLLPSSDAGWVHVPTEEMQHFSWFWVPSDTQAKGTIRSHLHNYFITKNHHGMIAYGYLYPHPFPSLHLHPHLALAQTRVT